MIEVIVPVYNALGVLEKCLESLDRTLAPGHPIHLIDDASTDRRIRPMLRDFSRSRSGVSLTEQESNVGFVRTCNRALETGSTDVVLLNSDTLVTKGWLDRLARCAATDERIATITPFSNNAEICSFPDFCRANPVPPNPDLVARVFATTGEPTYPDLPTAVGFCMYLRRRALEQLGLFDAETFGLGYGEENDFCMRARRAGWRNVLCDDAYVAHVGNQSFGERGLAPGGDNLQRLLDRYPDYEELVAQFIASDPLAERRRELATALEDAYPGQI